jgi:hypothetical protein
VGGTPNDQLVPDVQSPPVLGSHVFVWPNEFKALRKIRKRKKYFLDDFPTNPSMKYLIFKGIGLILANDRILITDTTQK